MRAERERGGEDDATRALRAARRSAGRAKEMRGERPAAEGLRPALGRLPPREGEGRRGLRAG